MDKSKLAVSTYNKIAGIYSDKYSEDLSDTPYIDKFLSIVHPKSKILEVGSGPGQFVKYIAGKGFKATGIDLSEKMVEIAKMKVPKAKFEVMDMRDLKFKDETFDGLMAPYSLIHIPSEEINKTLKGFLRVLKPDGKLLIIVQAGEADKIVNEPLKVGEITFVNFFTKERLSKLLIEAGFRIFFMEEKETKDSGAMSNRVIYAIAQKA